VKLGAGEIDKACENLLKLKKQVDTDKMSEPSFLMIRPARNTRFK